MKQTGCQEYQKVLSYFYDLVKDGTLTWGSKLPTERKIAEQLGIGRNSAREAICVLHGMGVVERKQGSGNYVAENIGQSFGSMIQMLLLLNGVTKSEICEFRRAMEKMAGNLLLENGIDEKIKQKLSDLLHTMAELTGEPLAKKDKEFHDTLVFATKNNLLITIMQAGLNAPSGCNKQTTSLIAVDDKDILQKLHNVINPPVGETAPAIICVLTQRINAYRDKCFAVQDYSAAIENMLLALVELGYQSCWYEGHITDEDKIGYQMAQILNVPDDYELVCFLPIGIPEEENILPKKRPFEERAWFNTFPVDKR